MGGNFWVRLGKNGDREAHWLVETPLDERTARFWAERLSPACIVDISGAITFMMLPNVNLLQTAAVAAMACAHNRVVTGDNYVPVVSL